MAVAFKGIVIRSIRLYCRFSSSNLSRQSLISQFQHIKSQYPDHLLLFQVGDFYEILGTDAELVASRTTLRISQRSNTSLTGFPVRSFKEWQKILLDSGFKLAICNQTMKRDESNRLFDREVVQLVTPGTILDPDKPTSNYLMAIIPGPSHTFGIAWIDLSTSRFEVSLVNDSQLEEFMEKLHPSEMIIPEDWKPDRDNLPTSDSMKYLTKLLKTWKDCQLTSIPSDWTSSLNTITSSYQDILNASSYSETSLLEQQAVIAILNYISCTQRNLVPLIDIPIRYSHDSHMMIDANTRRSLELVNPLHSNARRLTLLGSIDRTVTAGGKRLLHQRLSSPLTRVDDINKRLNVVEYFYKHYEICDWFRQLLKSSSDLERELQKVAIGNASLMDLVSVLNTLKIAQEILLYLDDEVLTSLKDELNGLQEFPELIHELTNAINKEEMTIATGYSLQMDSIREELLNNTNTVHMMADSIIKNYGINKLNVSSHKQYGRVFETTRVQSKKLDKHLIKVDQTQSAVRFLTPELQILNTRYQELSNEYEQMERTICSKLLDKIMDNMKGLKLLAKSLANLDVAMTLANVARLKGYSRPVIVCDPIYNVIGGYHPVLADTTQVVPNDCHMSPDSSNVHIITGPNMGGKSTFLRQMALLSILGQMGSFVPVKTAKLGVVDRLFARIGASDNIVKQMSTFYVEMNETSHILANATSQSLILMDEIGRGTATNEGVALARSIVEYIHDSIECRTFLATHFHELNVLSQTLSKVSHYKVSAYKDENQNVIMSYLMEHGYCDDSMGIAIAKMAGLPNPVIQCSLALVRKLKTS